MIVDVGFRDKKLATAHLDGDVIRWEGDYPSIALVIASYEKRAAGRELLQTLCERLKGQWWAHEVDDPAEMARWVEETGPRGARRWRNADNPTAKPVYQEPADHEDPNYPIQQDGYKFQYKEHALEEVQRLLPGITHSGLARLAGFTPGAKVTVYATGHEILIAAKHAHYEAGRRIYPESGRIENAFFNTVRGKERQGVGRTMLVTQVTQALVLGFKTIETTAQGDGDGTLKKFKDGRYTGYYAWARLGYDGPIPEMALARLAQPYRDLSTVQEVLREPGGKDEWYRHGSTFHGTFDLSEGSLSRRTLQAYLDEKKASMSDPREEEAPAEDDMVPDGDILTDEDDDILDRVWEKLRQEDARVFTNWVEERGPHGARRWRNADNPAAKPRYEEPPEPPRAIHHEEEGVKVVFSNPGDLAALTPMLPKATPISVARLAGFTDGSTVHVTISQENPSAINVSGDHPDYHADRIIFPDQGTIQNVDFQVREGVQGKGIGARMLVTQAREAVVHGFTHITTFAGGTGDGTDQPKSASQLVGYYAWGRLGYDGPLDSNMVKVRLPREFRNALTVQDVLSREGGEKAWYRHGFPFRGVFDVQSGSRSLAILEAYLREKSYNFAVMPAAGDILTQEDEEILSRIWDQVAREGWESLGAAFVQIDPSVIKVDVPLLPQRKDFSCGACSLASVCLYYRLAHGHPRRLEDDFIKKVKADPEEGTTPEHLAAAAKEAGLIVVETGDGFTLDSLRHHLDAGRPVICDIQAWGQDSPTLEQSYANDEDGHYVVAIGYDAQNFYFEDPCLPKSRGYLPSDVFDARWHDREREKPTDHWGLALDGPPEEAEPIR